MKKSKVEKSIFCCEQCGYQSRKWLGRCSECGEWGSMVEQFPVETSKQNMSFPAPLAMAPDEDENRLTTGIDELDRTLGGGFVSGSVVLLGGDPGIGKSTLMLHLLDGIAKHGKKVLYVSGEESAHQIKLRAKRLNTTCTDIYLATQNSVDAIVSMASEMKPAILVVDSVQTLSCGDINSAPGSVSQVRESSARLLEMAKKEDIPIVLVGHVTKDGAIAGPKILEHMVDTVLYFEGDNNHAFRILRTVKNRFGTVSEIGVFEMMEEGLVEVNNPSEIFLAERPEDVPGSAVLASVKGSRPILVEVQALVSPTNLGTARRTAIGADQQRLSLLCAVLEKKAGLDLYGNDIYLNLAGGIRIDEPALDLAVMCALSSSLLDKSIASGTVMCGEVGLAGEIRAVGHIEMRIKEARRLGFSRFIMPKGNKDRIPKGIESMKIEAVSTINEVMEIIQEG